MIQLSRQEVKETHRLIKGELGMLISMKRIIIIAIIALIAFVLGRLAVRAVMNMLLGGTLFGGNFL